MSITDKIAAAGVVGCGGAGFPTHAKLKGTFEHLIINGAECEPLLRTDRYIMLNKANELVKALCAITKELNVPHCTIALKADYKDEIASLEKAKAEAEELNMEAMEAVSGGSPTVEDEKGHDGWCVTAWHCFAATLHTSADSPDVSCWKDFLCMFVNKDYDDWVKRHMENEQKKKSE